MNPIIDADGVPHCNQECPQLVPFPLRQLRPRVPLAACPPVPAPPSRETLQVETALEHCATSTLEPGLRIDGVCMPAICEMAREHHEMRESLIRQEIRYLRSIHGGPVQVVDARKAAECRIDRIYKR